MEKMLGEQNEEISISFRYAERIQKALLPDEKDFKELFADYFLFYRPKNIVGGDFYWTSERGEHTILSVGDCTGHGIPGALITMLGISALNDIVKSQKETHPNVILKKLRGQIVGELNESDNLNHYDGMDIAICSVNPNSQSFMFAGANSSILVVRQNEMIEIKGNNMPVGPFWDDTDFTVREIGYQPGDMIYLFTDGYKNQFGQRIDKKFGKQRFKELIRNIRHQNLDEQKRAMQENFNQWKGNKDQVDDVTVLGVKF